MRRIRTINAFAWRQRLTLEGRDVELRLRWDARLASWYATMLDGSTSEEIFAGVRVELGWPIALASRVARGDEDEEVPAGLPGCLVALDITSRGVELDDQGFERGISLLYLSREEVESFQDRNDGPRLVRIERLS